MSAPHREPLIRAASLTLGWPDNVLLQDASFEVAHGDIFAILGRSGSGKSVMLRHLIGLETPLSGEIRVDGADPRDLLGHRPKLGVMFQSGALLGSRTVLDNVALPLLQWTPLPREAIDAIARSKLRMVGLEGAEHQLPSQISGGMRKRAAIARAMALEPSLLFLDEPSAALDPVTAAELDDLLLTLNASLSLTLVVVTHELESIFKVAKHCIMLDKQSRCILARGEPRALCDQSDDPRVRRFFQRKPERTQ